MTETRLCALDDIPAEGSNGIVAEISGQAKAVFAVRKGDQVYVYENICPHYDTPLDVIPGEFLNDDQTHIECGTHLAQFRIEDGYCTEGPCAGDSLTQIKAEVRGEDVYILPS